MVPKPTHAGEIARAREDAAPAATPTRRQTGTGRRPASRGTAARTGVTGSTATETLLRPAVTGGGREELEEDTVVRAAPPRAATTAAPPAVVPPQPEAESAELPQPEEEEAPAPAEHSEPPAPTSRISASERAARRAAVRAAAAADVIAASFEATIGVTAAAAAPGLDAAAQPAGHKPSAAAAPAAAPVPPAAPPAPEQRVPETETAPAPVAAPATRPAAQAPAAPVAPVESVPLAPPVAPPVERAPAAPPTERIPAASPVEQAPAPAETDAPAALLHIAHHPRHAPDPASSEVVLDIRDLYKRFGDNIAVDGVSLQVRQGSFYGIVGPNGAGKTTTLSIVTGLLRPDAGTVHVHGVDVWHDPVRAKRSIGVLPDRLRLFDRLTGAQLLYYCGTLRGIDPETVRERAADLAAAFGLEDALGRLVADYSAGMTKKVALAAAMIHSPRVLVLDEPFESVDPVSAANVIEILQRYVAAGGTVMLSSHGMELIERVCDSVAIIVRGMVLDAGSVEDVRGAKTLEQRFIELAGGRKAAEGMEWLHSFSD